MSELDAFFPPVEQPKRKEPAPVGPLAPAPTSELDAFFPKQEAPATAAPAINSEAPETYVLNALANAAEKVSGAVPAEARHLGNAVMSGIDFAAKNLDRLQRPIINALYPAVAMAAGQSAEAQERFDWGKSKWADDNGLVGELYRGAAMTAQAFGRGITQPLSAQHPGNDPQDSITGMDLATMAAYQESLQKHPELLQQHPAPIFGLGLLLEFKSPTVLKYLRGDYLSKLAKQYAILHPGADAVSAEQAIIAKAKSAEVRSGVHKVLQEMEAENRAREAANAAARVERRTMLPSLESPLGFLGNLREAPGQVYEAASDASRAYLAPAAAKLSDILSKVPYVNAEASLARDKAAAEAALAKMPEGWAPAATAVGQAEQGIRHVAALELPFGIEVGTGHVLPGLNKMTYKAISSVIDNLENKEAYGEAAKAATVWALGKANYRDVVPKPWIDAVGDVGQALGDTVQKYALKGKRALTPTFGDAGYDAANLSREMLGKVGGEEAAAVAGSYKNLQAQGAAALRMDPQEFATQVARCESKAFYDQANPIVQRTWDLFKKANDEYTSWWNANGGARKLLDEEGLNNYFPHMITPEHKAYIQQQRAIGELSSGAPKTRQPVAGPMRFSDRDRFGYQRKLIDGDGTAYGINQELRAKYGLDHDVFLTDPAPVIEYRARATANAFNNRRFVEQVKDLPIAKRVGWDREATPEGMVGKRIVDEKGRIERAFVPEEMIDDVAKQQRGDIVKEYRDARYQLMREHKGTKAQRAADAAAARRPTPPALEQEVRLQGTYGAGNEDRVLRTTGESATFKAEQPNVVKVADLFSEPSAPSTPLDAAIEELRTVQKRRREISEATKAERAAWDAAPGDVHKKMTTVPASPERIALEREDFALGQQQAKLERKIERLEAAQPQPKVADLFPEAKGTAQTETVERSVAKMVPPPPPRAAVKRALYQYDPKRPIAAQLKDLRVNMREEINKSWKRFLDQGLREGWARKATDKLRAPGEGYVAVRNPAFTGYAFPKEIAAEIDRVMPVMENMDTGTYDKITQWFRAQALLTPRYHIRNFIGNEYNKILYTGLGAHNVTQYLQAHAMSWATTFGNREMKIATPGFTGTLGELDDILRERGALGYAMTAAETPTGVRALGRAFTGNRWLASQIEDQGRRQMVINQLLSGRSLEGAIDDTFTTLFNYARKSNLERNFLSRATYFWSWPRNNVPYQLEMFVRHPMRQMTLPMLVRQMGEYYGRAYPEDEGYGDKLSRYMIDKMPVTAKRDSGTGVRDVVLFGETLPVENVNMALGPLAKLLDNAGDGPGIKQRGIDAAEEMATALLSMGAQPFKALIEAAFNFDTFFGNVIDKYKAADPDDKLGLRQPAKLGPVVMTATEKHVAKTITAAMWADSLFEASGSEAYRHKPWFIRALKALGLSVVEVDPAAEDRRTDVRRKGIAAEAERQVKNTKARLEYNDAPFDGDYPLLREQQKNVDRAKDVIQGNPIHRPWY